MSDDYWDEPSRWFDEDGMPTTPIELYGVTRRFAMGAERWDYYHALHLEKSKGSYNPCYCDECRIKKEGVDK